MSVPNLFDKLTSEISLSEILDNIDAGIVIYNANGDYVFVNTVMINWRNVSREQFLSMNVHDFERVIDVCVFDLVCQEKRQVSRLQYYRDYRSNDTASRVRLVTGSPVFDENGNIRYVIMLLQDVKSFENQCKSLVQSHPIISASSVDSRAETLLTEVVAESPATKQLLALADNISPLDSTIMLYGESGTGKEVFAHYIHEHSRRRSHPIVTVNCASFPDNLIEAELFGYEKGSFTGASKEGKTGLVEAANRGTLFLDEINSLPLQVQGKLLRMIEEKTIQRIGAVKTRRVDFRLIAATNEDLATLVRRGEFREDLYYRLNVVPLTIPPLRSRRADILPLCRHFLEYFCKKYNLQKTFSPYVLEQVCQYDWPGNIRELRNFVERMVVMTPYATTEINNIPEGMLQSGTFQRMEIPAQHPPRAPKSEHGRLDRERVIEALSACGGHREKAAAYLGVSRRYLQYKIHEYHISERCRY